MQSTNKQQQLELLFDREIRDRNYARTLTTGGSSCLRPARNRKPNQHQRIIRLMATNGNGWTREEIALGLGLRLASVCARVRELIDWGRCVEITSETRSTTSGSDAKVVYLVEQVWWE